MSDFDENRDWQIDFDDKESYHESQMNINYTEDRILKLLELFKIRSCLYNGSSTEAGDDDIEVIGDQNKQLRQEIDSKLEELRLQQIQYENIKRDQKLISQEIKETHEALLTAKKFYKCFLNIYYTIETRNDNKHTVFVQFFTDNKKDTDVYSIRLVRDVKTRIYELLGTNPGLGNTEELSRILKETEDVPGLLCCVRQAFLAHKKNKHKCLDNSIKL